MPASIEDTARILDIADVVDDLSRLLDRLFDHCDDDVRRRFEEIWPGHAEVHSGVVRDLKGLADQLTPLSKD